MKSFALTAIVLLALAGTLPVNAWQFDIGRAVPEEPEAENAGAGQAASPSPRPAVSSSTGSGTRSVNLLVRKVDDQLPYFRRMSFRVPLELNYALPAGQLVQDLKKMLSSHCNTTNITRLVLNDLILVETDVDVWKLRDSSRIEIWSRGSGFPTRARTAGAFARGAARLNQKCSKLAKKLRAKKAKKGRGRRPRPQSREEDDDLERDIGDEAIVVPDFDGDGERDSDYFRY